jgi:hypothetical protein
MNMIFSGVAGSRPARELSLADGDGKRTVKGRDSSHAAFRPRRKQDFQDQDS